MFPTECEQIGRPDYRRAIKRPGIQGMAVCSRALASSVNDLSEDAACAKDLEVLFNSENKVGFPRPVIVLLGGSLRLRQSGAFVLRAMGSPMITRGLPRLLLARARAPSANLRLTVDPAGPLADKGAELLVCVAGSFLAVPVAPGNAVLCVNGDVGEVLGPASTDSDAEAAAALQDNVARTVHVRPVVDLKQALTRRGISVLRDTHKAGPSRNEQLHHHAPVALAHRPTVRWPPN
jgi:hypothetical protein